MKREEKNSTDKTPDYGERAEGIRGTRIWSQFR